MKSFAVFSLLLVPFAGGLPVYFFCLLMNNLLANCKDHFDVNSYLFRISYTCTCPLLACSVIRMIFFRILQLTNGRYQVDLFIGKLVPVWIYLCYLYL